MCSTHGFWHKVLGVLAFFVVEQVSDNTRQQEQNVFWTSLLFQNNAGKMLTCIPLVQQNCRKQLRAPIHPHVLPGFYSKSSWCQTAGCLQGQWTLNHHNAPHSPGPVLVSWRFTQLASWLKQLLRWKALKKCNTSNTGNHWSSWDVTEMATWL